MNAKGLHLANITIIGMVLGRNEETLKIVLINIFLIILLILKIKLNIIIKINE